MSRNAPRIKKKSMISTIHINRLALYGYHGVIPQENKVGAKFYITLSINVEVSDDAIIKDQLSGTVSYASIIDSIRKEMTKPAALLEHLAYRMGQKLLADFGTIRSLSIRVDKENPPCGVKAESIGIEMRMFR